MIQEILAEPKKEDPVTRTWHIRKMKTEVVWCHKITEVVWCNKIFSLVAPGSCGWRGAESCWSTCSYTS